jgi:Secretion system C-terminal sorting domain
MKKNLLFSVLLGMSTFLFAQDVAVLPKKITFKEAEALDNIIGPPALKIGNEFASISKKPIPLEFLVPENANIKRSNVENRIGEDNVQANIQGKSPLPTSSFNGLDDNASFIPPDTKGAAGPNHLMVTLNSQYRITDKAGGVISTVLPTSFWSGITPDGAGDPHIIYNHYINRWILIAQSNLNATSSLLVAMSTTNDPTGTWNRYVFDVDATNTNVFDYPLVGFNQNMLVIAANTFNLALTTFTGSQIYLFNIADLSAGSAITIGTNAQRITNNTTQGGSTSPVTVFESGAPSNTMYTIQAWNGGSAATRLVTLTGTIPAVVWNTASAVFPTGSTTWSGSQGDFTPQLGDTRKINSGDNRPGNFVMVNGKLWWAHHIFLPAAAPTRSAIQWWQLQTNGTILQRGLIDDPTGVIHRTYPSLAINANEDVLIGYSMSSVNQYISAAYSYRMPCMPANAMQSEVVYKNGLSSYYKTFSASPTARNRWGDYSNTCLDPTTGDFWTLQEYAGLRVGSADNNSRWGTWWAKVTPLPAAAASQINFDTETININELGNTGTCPKYRDYPITVGVFCAAIGNATLTFNKAGTATDITDYELLTNTVSYVNAETGNKSITLRVYDDGNVEPNETIILTYTITGTGVTASPTSQTLTINITDNDVVPANITGNAGAPLLSENFNASTSLPTGWTITTVSGSTNQWVVSANGGVDFTGNAAHITNDIALNPLAYTNTSTTNRTLVSSNINATGLSNLSLSFKYKCNAEAGFDFGTLVYTLNGTTFFDIEGPYVNTTALTLRTVALPAACNNTNFKLGWRFISDNIDGTNPPLIIDDIVVTATSTLVATTAALTKIENVKPGNTETYFLSTVGNELIAKLKNSSADVGCVTASLLQAGNGQTALNTTTGSYQRADKVISISPAIANTTATYEASIYFTNAELAIWGVNKLALKILKVNDAVDLASTITGSQATLITPTVVDNSATAGYVEFKGNFTGFSKFILVSPNVVLPITLLNFDGKIFNGNAILNWTTSQEIDNSGFAIERSLDGINFKEIGWVNGNGTISAERKFDFIDPDLAAESYYYYRLKQVDFNNKFSYSKVIKLNFDNAFADVATILPNPIKDVLQIQLHHKITNVKYTVFDAVGRVIESKKLENPGNIIRVDAKNWASGKYSLLLNFDNKTFSTSFLK